jgi:hypothetical protein
MPENFLEIEVCDPQTHGEGNQMFTDYAVNLNVCNANIFLYFANILK